MRATFDVRRFAAAALLLAVAGPRGFAADEESIAPFAAHYTAEWRSITVGTSDIELRAGPMHTASSAKRTCSECRSASE